MVFFFPTILPSCPFTRDWFLVMLVNFPLHVILYSTVAVTHHVNRGIPMRPRSPPRSRTYNGHYACERFPVSIWVPTCHRLRSSAQIVIMIWRYNRQQPHSWSGDFLRGQNYYFWNQNVVRKKKHLQSIPVIYYFRLYVPRAHLSTFFGAKKIFLPTEVYSDINKKKNCSIAVIIFLRGHITFPATPLNESLVIIL